MAITGAWKDRQSVQASALKWGTGVNPVHATYTGDGRNIAPSRTTGIVPDEMTESFAQEHGDEPWIYATDTPEKVGTPDHPNWDTTTELTRSEVPTGWPQWGPYEGGLPGGSYVRSEIHGAGDQQTPTQVPTETVTEGWRNKETGTVSDSKVSSTDQLLMQTSMKQRDQTRAGSQRGSGSASEFRQPIKSRIPGKRIKVFSGGERHYDMKPREQQPRLRSWWNRQAGTGRVTDMQSNAERPRKPLTREPPPNPDTGPSVGTDSYGYVPEDSPAFVY